MTNEIKNLSLREAHPSLNDGGMWFLIGGLVLASILLTYSLVIAYPESIKQNEEIKTMDCQTLKDHLMKHDLTYVDDMKLQSLVIGKCLK